MIKHSNETWGGYRRAALLASVYPVAYENKAGWKLDADGKMEVGADGNPIWINADGKEASVGGDTISRLNGEAMTHRLAKEAAEKALATFVGPDGKPIDPTKALAALDTVGKLDSKALIDAGEVDKVRDEVSKTYTAQLAEKDTALGSLQSRVDNMLRSTAIRNSKYIADNIAVPIDMFEATFGKYLKVEADQLVPYGADGNKIYSSKRVGEVADIDEAFEKMVESYSDKERILKAPDARGSGNNGGGGNRGGGRYVTRAQLEAMSPQQVADVAAKQRAGEVTLID